MKHLNSVPGFTYVRPVSETGQRSRAFVAGEYFWLRDCVCQGGDLWAGQLVNCLKAHLHGLKSDDFVTFTPPPFDPHAEVQGKYGLVDTLREYPEAIDQHVLSCEECRKKVIGFTCYLPKLRARMTVSFVGPLSDASQIEKLELLTPGLCLPCGCEVTGSKWTEEIASSKFYQALAEVLEIPEAYVKEISYSTKLIDLPLDTRSLRRLRDRFWSPNGSSSSVEVRDAEEGEVVLGLPDTVGEFIARLLALHSGFTYAACAIHW